MACLFFVTPSSQTLRLAQRILKYLYRDTSPNPTTNSKHRSLALDHIRIYLGSFWIVDPRHADLLMHGNASGGFPTLGMCFLLRGVPIVGEYSVMGSTLLGLPR